MGRAASGNIPDMAVGNDHSIGAAGYRIAHMGNGRTQAPDLPRIGTVDMVHLVLAS